MTVALLLKKLKRQIVSVTSVTKMYFDKLHPTKINPEKLKLMMNKNHIPGQIYLDKGLPTEWRPKKKKKKVSEKCSNV